MKLCNKTTKEIWDIPEWRTPAVQEGDICFFAELNGEGKLFSYKSLDDLNKEWEDYEPAEPIFDDEKVSKAIRAWLSIQVQPIEAVSILCSKDNDGFFSYNLYGYIAKARIVDGKAVVNHNLSAIGFDFRSDVYFEHERGHDYTIAELCGEEEE